MSARARVQRAILRVFAGDPEQAASREGAWQDSAALARSPTPAPRCLTQLRHSRTTILLAV